MVVPHHVSQYVSKMIHHLPGRRGIAGENGTTTLGSQFQLAAKKCFKSKSFIFYLEQILNY
jgi:hypothetical protein